MKCCFALFPGVLIVLERGDYEASVWCGTGDGASTLTPPYHLSAETSLSVLLASSQHHLSSPLTQSHLLSCPISASVTTARRCFQNNWREVKPEMG